MVLSKDQREKALKVVASEHIDEWERKGCRVYVNGLKVIYRQGNKLTIKTFTKEKEVADFLNHYYIQHPSISPSATCLAIMKAYKVRCFNEYDDDRIDKKMSSKKKSSKKR